MRRSLLPFITATLSVVLLTSCTVNINSQPIEQPSLPSEVEQTLVACGTVRAVQKETLEQAIDTVKDRLGTISGFQAKLAIQIRLHHEDLLKQLENEQLTGEETWYDVDRAFELLAKCREFEEQ